MWTVLVVDTTSCSGAVAGNSGSGDATSTGTAGAGLAELNKASKPRPKPRFFTDIYYYPLTQQQPFAALYVLTFHRLMLNMLLHRLMLYRNTWLAHRN